jgi:zinc transport system substrate-binding protein
MKKQLLLPFILFSIVCSQPVIAAPPQVIVSIPPLHALASGVLEGVTTAKLLIQTGSPHSYSLRPSDARALQEADLLIWVGPQLELFLTHSQQNLGAGRSLTLIDLPGLHRPALRHGGLWAEETTETAPAHDHGHDDDNDGDAHIWLDPDNAALIVKAIADRVTALDPVNGVRYQQNGADYIHRLRSLDHELKTRLQPVQQQPYVVFHDAFQPFEQHYDLHPVGAIAIDPERRPGARRLQEIRDVLLQAKAVCLFREPQFEPRYVPLLIEGTQVRTGILDPLGSSLTPGPELYFDLLRNLTDSLVSCLDETP